MSFLPVARRRGQRRSNLPEPLPHSTVSECGSWSAGGASSPFLKWLIGSTTRSWGRMVRWLYFQPSSSVSVTSSQISRDSLRTRICTPMMESRFTWTSAPSEFPFPPSPHVPQSVARDRTAHAPTIPRRILKKRSERRKPSRRSEAAACTDPQSAEALAERRARPVGRPCGSARVSIDLRAYPLGELPTKRPPPIPPCPPPPG